MDTLKNYFQKHHQWVINVVLFISIGQYIYRETQIYKIFKELNFIDITFFISSLVFLTVILIRRNYQKVDTNWSHWLVATVSFFSNMYFIKTNPATGIILNIANVISLLALLIGLAALLSLGRSFGVVPAVRVVKTGGAYRFVRHPMYLSDIITKIPIVMKYMNVYNVAIFIIAIVLYVLRIHFEEQLLREFPEYQEYMKKVRYRFIPFIY
jgi:protein-S-isoprenylcysteine O-methyltransferase Ste14